MANHKSSLKRIRSNERKRLYNRYYARTMRNAIKNIPFNDGQKGSRRKTSRNGIHDRQDVEKEYHSQEQGC
jgi:ribosomal protein S20